MLKPPQDEQAEIDARYMRLAVSLARQSPPKPSNYCVGAVIVDSDSNEVISTGYTLELPGNTHAEQCCLQKLALNDSESQEIVSAPRLPQNCTLYTTLEPCSRRLSGNMACVDRIISSRKDGTGIQRVVVGRVEPDTFVSDNSGATTLRESGLRFDVLQGFEAEVLEVATTGHRAG